MFVAMMQLDLLQGDSFIIQRPYRGGGDSNICVQQ